MLQSKPLLLLIVCSHLQARKFIFHQRKNIRLQFQLQLPPSRWWASGHWGRPVKFVKTIWSSFSYRSLIQTFPCSSRPYYLEGLLRRSSWLLKFTIRLIHVRNYLAPFCFRNCISQDFPAFLVKYAYMA